VTDRFNPSRTLSALSDPSLAVTHYFAVPVMAETLLAQPEFERDKLSRLQAIFVGGAPLSGSLAGRYLSLGIPLVNGYGMSEAGTAIHVPPDVASVRASGGGVGIAAPYIRVRLVRDGREVEDGEIGELWISGPSVSPGYWQRPIETAAAFVDGWYRTGDLARRRDGQYHIVDRLKEMYISGGENVYPAEVEAVLRLHPSVHDAAVIGVADDRWGETGVAFVRRKDGATADTKALLAHCVERLAKYKCPRRVVFIDALPRSAAGKLLKTALRERLAAGDYQ
jgi:fatty-acyl-CoA synthase